MAAYKQLDTDKRIRLQTLLESHHSFQQIAIELDTSKSTISREVRRYRVNITRWGSDISTAVPNGEDAMCRAFARACLLTAETKNAVPAER